MKLLQIWKRLGKQPLKITRQKDAVAIICGKEYPITSMKYNNGIPIGFEVDIQPEDIAFVCENKNCAYYQNCNKNASVGCIPIILEKYRKERRERDKLVNIINDIKDSTLGESWYIIDPVGGMQGFEIIRDEIHKKYYDSVNAKNKPSIFKRLLRNNQK